MKFALTFIVLLCFFQATFQFALRNDFEDDDIFEFVDRKAREAVPVTEVVTLATEETKEVIEASGEEVPYPPKLAPKLSNVSMFQPLPTKSLVKRDKPVEAEIEASGQESESPEESRPKRSIEAVEGSGEEAAVTTTATIDVAEDAGRQRRVAGEEIIEASGEEEATTITA